MQNKVQKILTVIQARTSSTRLPGKVMLNILGRPILSLMIERVMRSRLAGTVVVAATEEPEDDMIEELCLRENINCFRGNKTDLLDRHYRAAIKYNADIIVKVPSDCPLIDHTIIDKVLEFYLEHIDEYDYASNLHPATYPDGNDVEAFSFSSLHESWKNARKDYEREHTTPYIWDNPSNFAIGNVVWKNSGFDYSLTHRWTLDYEEDYKFIRSVFEELYPHNPDFGLKDILGLVESRPYLKTINEKLAGINWYRHYKNELKTIKPVSGKQMAF